MLRPPHAHVHAIHSLSCSSSQFTHMWPPAHRKLAIEEAMFQVDTSEANDETSTESGAIDETVHVREAIEDFLENF